MDDANLRLDISRILKAKQAHIAAERSRSADARTMAALTAVFETPEREVIPLKELTDHINANGDDLDDPLSPRQVGQILRTRSIPIRKSHGTIVVAKPAH